MYSVESGPAQDFAQFLQGAPGAAVLHGTQFGFGVLGALQGGFQFGVERVGEGVAFAELEVVEVAGRQVEGGFEAGVFVGEEVSVEAVEEYVLVSPPSPDVPRCDPVPMGFRAG